MKSFFSHLICICFPLSLCFQTAFGNYELISVPDPVKLDNPISVKYIKSNLRKTSPRLILTPAIEKKLKSKLKSDPIVKNYFAAMKLNAAQILKEPLLTREVIGRRLL